MVLYMLSSLISEISEMYYHIPTVCFMNLPRALIERKNHYKQL